MSSTATIFTVRSALRRLKVNGKVWITLKELSMFYRVTIWLTQLRDFAPAVKLLNSRIVTLVNNNGWNFTFLYLKEALRLTFRALAGQPERGGDKLPRVVCDPTGFPKIIPLSLRRALREPLENVNIVRGTLTLLSCFRVFPTKVTPDTGTITSPFSGVTRTLPFDEVKAASRKLSKSKLKFGRFKGFISESAGPNGNKATWSCAIDAFAFITHPYNFIAFCKIGFATRSYGYLAWLLMILFLFSPLYLILLVTRCIERPLYMGRLSVVYDQAGKARIVAITNWWVQLALKPLHNRIFHLLEGLECDGTFDQTKPLRRLLDNSDPSSKFYSFDLTAATDRLPIDLQVQVLSAMGADGDLWRQLLSFDWFYKDKYYTYSVGQPMGAYSSWAMLALTHHVIVHIAARRARIKGTFYGYAVLGDDIVINNDAVASEYLKLMDDLGVTINLSKTIQSADYIEFAKRFCTSKVDFSPIGPGNILSYMRKPYFISSLVREAYLKGYLPSPDTVLALIASLPKNLKKMEGLVVWTSLSVIGFFTTLNPGIQQKLERGSSKGSMTGNKLICYQSAYAYGVLTHVDSEITKAETDLESEEVAFYQNWWKTTAQKTWPLRLLESCTLPFSPSFWLYALSFDRAREVNVQVRQEFEQLKQSGAGYEECTKLIKLDPSSGLSLDWKDAQRVKSFNTTYTTLYKLIWSRYEYLVRKSYSDPFGFGF